MVVKEEESGYNLALALGRLSAFRALTRERERELASERARERESCCLLGLKGHSALRTFVY